MKSLGVVLVPMSRRQKVLEPVSVKHRVVIEGGVPEWWLVGPSSDD